MQAEGTEVGVGPKTENQKIEEKKRPSAIIKAILCTVNSESFCLPFPESLRVTLLNTH